MGQYTPSKLHSIIVLNNRYIAKGVARVARFSIWWQNNKWRVLIGVAIIVVFIAFAFLVYIFGWNWTGFNGGYHKITTTRTTHGAITTTEQPPTKTLWDWLQLLTALAIPVVVGFGVAWFTTKQTQASEAANKQRHETELEITSDNQREAALQEAGLIERGKSIIDLNGADLSEANLRYADLSQANLSKANLHRAILIGAKLTIADLTGAVLGGAKLTIADLTGAKLNNANLYEADLRLTILGGADLSGAFGTTPEQLKRAKSLKDTTMPDGSKHP